MVYKPDRDQSYGSSGGCCKVRNSSLCNETGAENPLEDVADRLAHCGLGPAVLEKGAKSAVALGPDGA